MLKCSNFYQYHQKTEPPPKIHVFFLFCVLIKVIILSLFFLKKNVSIFCVVLRPPCSRCHPQPSLYTLLVHCRWYHDGFLRRNKEDVAIINGRHLTLSISVNNNIGILYIVSKSLFLLFSFIQLFIKRIHSIHHEKNLLYHYRKLFRVV